MVGRWVERWLPGVHVAARYERAWLRKDLTAGVVITALLIPAGMGYAQAAGLPPVTGLYATVVPLVVYAVFGPSRVLVVGPDSALAPLIAVSILPLAGGDAERAVALSGLLALMSGAILVIAGLLRAGLVTDLLSNPIRVGYLNGLAVIVVVSQLPALLGVSVEDGPIPAEVGATWGEFAAERVDGHALGIGLASLAVILVLRRLVGRAPAVLVAVVAAIGVVAATGWGEEFPVVGALPSGLPAPALEGLTWSDAGDLAVPALAIALVAFADSSVLARVFAARRGTTTDGNQEMRAMGLTNVASGLAGGFPVSASGSRTPVAEAAGAKTQLTTLVSAALIVVFVLAAPDLTAYLPEATLAAVVVVSALGLVDIRAWLRLVRMDRVEGMLSLSAFLGVVLVGVLQGIVVAIALSFVAFVNQAWRPYRAELGRVPGTRGYHDMSRHPGAERVDGVVILRFDAPLFFANGRIFNTFVRRAVRDAPGEVRKVVLAAEPITRIDTSAVDELVEVDDYLADHGIDLVFAEMKGPVRDLLAAYGLDERFGPGRFAPTVGAAVDEITGEFRGDIEGDEPGNEAYPGD